LPTPGAPPRPADGPAASGGAAADGRLGDAFALAALVVAALCINVHAVRHGGVDLLDEGFEYQLASRILHGEVPYRDFFTVTTPLAFYLQALLIVAVGPGLIVGRLAAAVVGAGIAAALYLVGRRVAGRPLAFAVAAAWIPWGIPYWPQPNYSWYVILFELLAGWAALRAGEGRGRWWLAGLLAAAAVLTKQNVGSAAAAAVAVYALWRGGGRALRGYALGTGGPVLGFLLYLAAFGALVPFWRETVVFAIHAFPSAARIPYPPLHGLRRAIARGGTGGMEALVSYLPQAVLAAGVPVLLLGLLRRKPRLPEAFLLWCLTLAGLVIAYPRSDFVHIDYALAPAFLGLGWVLAALLGGPRRLLPLPLLLVGSLALSSLRAAPDPNGGVPFGAPYMAGLRTDPGTAAMFRAVVAAIDRVVPPGRPVLVLPWANLFYYLADRPDPTPYDLDITLNVPAGGDAAIAAAMARTHCPVFYLPHSGISEPFRIYGAPVLAELQAHYTETGTAGPYQIWQWRG